MADGLDYLSDANIIIPYHNQYTVPSTRIVNYLAPSTVDIDEMPVREFLDQ